MEGGEIRTRNPKPMSCRRCHFSRYLSVGLLVKGCNQSPTQTKPHHNSDQKRDEMEND